MRDGLMTYLIDGNPMTDEESVQVCSGTPFLCPPLSLATPTVRGHTITAEARIPTGGTTSTMTGVVPWPTPDSFERPSQRLGLDSYSHSRSLAVRFLCRRWGVGGPGSSSRLFGFRVVGHLELCRDLPDTRLARRGIQHRLVLCRAFVRAPPAERSWTTSPLQPRRLDSDVPIPAGQAAYPLNSCRQRPHTRPFATFGSNT